MDGQDETSSDHPTTSTNVPDTDSPHHDSSAAHDPTDPTDPNDPNDPKKPRACNSCRSLKVKCEPIPSAPDGPCKRCTKAGRSCIVTQPTRKRQKKTDSRVAELEKKIDALTATLQASRTPGVPGPALLSAASATTSAAARGSSVNNVPQRSASAEQTSPSTSSLAGWVAPPQRPSPQSLDRGLGIGDAIVAPSMLGQKRKFSGQDTGPRPAPASATEPQPPPAGHPLRPPRDATQEVADVVDRGIIDMEQATQLLVRYTAHMALHLPIVIFPQMMTAQDLRRSQPYLFLAIMAAASSEMPQVQRVLVKEFTQMLADKVVVIGEKSLELVQAILVGVIWYFPPEHFEELKFYQYVHMAGVMAIDIGLGKRKANSKSRLIPYTWRDHPFRKSPLPDPTTIESRRTWLGCFFLSANVAMALHRPNLIRWTPFMSECIDVLSKSPDAAPSDKTLCHFVWTHQLAEEIGVQFSMDDPGTHVNVAEAKTQHALKGFERDVIRYRDSIQPKEQVSSLTLAFHVISLYMHEIALYIDKPEEWRPPLNAEALRDPIPSLNETLTSAHISALSACLTAIDGIFETFLAMDAQTIRCLPIFNFVRVAYAVVVLIKMYFSSSSPNSELGKVINKDDMKVQEYLDRLLERFRETASSDKSRPAGKFLVVLTMLSGWFRKQEGSKNRNTEEHGNDPSAASRSNSATPRTQDRPPHEYQHQQQQGAGQWQQQGLQDYPQASTPLHLLSEVATGGGSSDGQHRAGQIPGVYQQQQGHWTPQASQTFMYNGNNNNNDTANANTGNNTTTASPAGGHTMPGPGQATMPWLAAAPAWANLDYSSLADNSGFEQAMGMTLTGFGDLTAAGGTLGLGGGSGGGDQQQQQQQEALDQMRYQLVNSQIISSILDDPTLNPASGWFQ